MKSLRHWARLLKADTLALWYAVRDPRTPWIARLLAGLVVAYALSPIDVIPDFIPVLGLLDDVILVPLGLALVRRLIPPQVLAEARAQAEHTIARPRSWLGAGVVILVWVVLGVVVLAWLMRKGAAPAV